MLVYRMREIGCFACLHPSSNDTSHTKPCETSTDSYLNLFRCNVGLLTTSRSRLKLGLQLRLKLLLNLLLELRLLRVGFLGGRGGCRSTSCRIRRSLGGQRRFFGGRGAAAHDALWK
jgi:hypothetical protein